MRFGLRRRSSITPLWIRAASSASVEASSRKTKSNGASTSYTSAMNAAARRTGQRAEDARRTKSARRQGDVDGKTGPLCGSTHF